MRKMSSRTLRFVVGLSLFVGAGSLVAQQAVSPQPNDAQTAQLVTQLVPRFHLHHPKIDDAASVKIFDGFLKMLDQGKMYFLKSDIESFASHRLTLDDEIKAGDVQFA
jgi:carboxyl-terminal processing protease